GLVATCGPKATLRNVGYFKALCLRESETDGSNPVPSSRESVSLGISPLHDEREAALGVIAPPSIETVRVLRLCRFHHSQLKLCFPDRRRRSHGSFGVCSARRAICIEPAPIEISIAIEGTVVQRVSDWIRAAGKH